MEVKAKFWDQTNTFKILFKYNAGPCNLTAINLGRFLKGQAKGKHDKFKDSDALSLIMRDKEDFFNLLCHTDRESTFTYCFKSDGRLYLCKTEGASYEGPCKHMWLCNKLFGFGDTGICCAGIMKITRPNKLYLDNLSGTYRPTMENLESLKGCLLQYFPELKVRLLNPFNSQKDKKTYCKIMDMNNIDYQKVCGEFSKLSSLTETSQGSEPATPLSTPERSSNSGTPRRSMTRPSKSGTSDKSTSSRKSTRTSSKRKSKRKSKKKSKKKAKSQKSSEFSSIDLGEL